MNYIKPYDTIINENHVFEKSMMQDMNNIDIDFNMGSGKFVVLCVSGNSEHMYEIQYLKNACVKCNAKFIYVNFAKEENFIKVIDGSCVLCMGDRMYQLERNNTLVIKRHAKMAMPNVAKNCRILSNNDFLVINTPASIKTSGDKALTIEKFNIDKVPQPKSLILNSKNIDDFDSVIKTIDFDFPVIAKVNKGSQGNGVFIFDTPQSLKGVAQYILSYSDVLDCTDIIVQEKIDSEYDLRLHVLRKESDPVYRSGDEYVVFAAMKRNKLSNDYRSNASLGAEYEYYEATEEEKKLAVAAAKSVRCAWCGVDIMKDKHTGKLYVIEVNSTPSLKGITAVAEKDPATEFIRNMKEAFGKSDDTSNDSEKIILGYREIFYINDFDKPLTALLDTGNGSLTSILVNDVKVNKEDGTVEWKLFGKKFKTKYDGDIGFRSSAGERVVQPTTRLDITHNGITYKNIRVKLSDIGDKRNINKSMNISRDLLQKMNAVVDISKKHVNSKHHEAETDVINK